MRLTSKLVNSIWRVFQKIIRYFNGTIISTFFVPLSPVWSIVFCLNLNKTLLWLLLLLLLLLLLSGKSMIEPALFKDGSSL